MLKRIFKYMADNQATIVLPNGDRYKTPMENLENVRRLVKYKEIILPGEESEMEVREEKEENGPEITTPKKRGPKPKGETN